MYIDSHCHLDFPVFEDHLEHLLTQSAAAGIKAMVVPGVANTNWQRVLQLATQHDGIYPALGLHPYFIEGEEPLSGLAGLIDTHRKQLVAVGEIGLDGAIETPLSVQEPLFERQLILAKEAELPVIVHAHKSYDRVLKYLRQHAIPRVGVIHAFAGSLQQAQQFIDLGFYLGVGGTITYPRASKTRGIMAQLPLSSLLLETDSPDMPLAGLQGQANTPLNIPRVAETLATLRQQSIDEIAAATTANCRKLFDLNQIDLDLNN